MLYIADVNVVFDFTAHSGSSKLPSAVVEPAKELRGDTKRYLRSKK